MISLFLCPFIYFISLCTASIGSASGIPSAGMPTEFNHVCTFKDVAKLLILGTISCFSLSFDVREFSKRENLNLINVPREFLCFLRFCVLLFILLVLEQLLLEMILEPLPLEFLQNFTTRILMISLFLCPFINFISFCTASIGSASGIPSAGTPTDSHHVCLFKDVAKLFRNLPAPLWFSGGFNVAVGA